MLKIKRLLKVSVVVIIIFSFLGNALPEGFLNFEFIEDITHAADGIAIPGLSQSVLDKLTPYLQDQINSENKISEVTQDYNTVSSALEEMLNKVINLTGDSASPMAELLVNGLQSQTKIVDGLIKKMDKDTELLDFSKKLSGLSEKIKSTNTPLLGLKDDLKRLAKKAFNKRFTVIIPAKENEDGSISAEISMQNVQNTDVWEENLGIRKSIVDKYAKSAVVLDVESNNLPRKADIAINSDIVKEANSKKVDQFVLKTGMANLSLNLKNLDQAKEKIDISISKPNIQTLDTAVQNSVKGNQGDLYDFKMNVDSINVSKLNKPIKITVPYELKAGELGHTISVFYVDDKGVLKNMAGFYDSKEKSVSFVTDHLSMFLIKKNEYNFNDTMQQPWAKDLIEGLASKGIITGSEDNNFSPSSAVTRAQFLTMVVTAGKLKLSSANSIFADVPNDEWYKVFVMTAYEKGIVKGSKGNFRPKELITRADMAVILANALNQVYDKNVADGQTVNTAAFPDENIIPDYAKAAIKGMVSMELLKGRENGNFAPLEVARRAEAAAVIYKMMMENILE